MKALVELAKREPIRFLAAVQGGITAAVTFGLELSNEQTGAIVGFTAAVLSLVARRTVSPTED